MFWRYRRPEEKEKVGITWIQRRRKGGGAGLAPPLVTGRPPIKVRNALIRGHIWWKYQNWRSAPPLEISFSAPLPESISFLKFWSGALSWYLPFSQALSTLYTYFPAYTYTLVIFWKIIHFGSDPHLVTPKWTVSSSIDNVDWSIPPSEAEF